MPLLRMRRSREEVRRRQEPPPHADGRELDGTEHDLRRPQGGDAGQWQHEGRRYRALQNMQQRQHHGEMDQIQAVGYSPEPERHAG